MGQRDRIRVEARGAREIRETLVDGVLFHNGRVFPHDVHEGAGILFIQSEIGLREDQSIYLEDYGHIGQIDQILSLELALKEGKVKDGDTVCMIAAGIGYTWAANIIQWGEN